MSLLLEQFLATYHLRIVAIPYFEPCGSLGIVRRVLMFNDNALEVQFAGFLKQSNSRLINVIRKDDRGQTVAEYSSQFFLSVQQPLASSRSNAMKRGSLRLNSKSLN
jgi:hypothetical protein